MISDPTNNLVSIYAWSDWGACSATCGKATRSRHLMCEPEGSPTSSAVRDLQKTAVRDWVNTDDNNSDFLSQMELGQGNCIPEWSEWTERISGEDKVRHIKELVDIDVSGNFGLSESDTHPGCHILDFSQISTMKATLLRNGRM